MNPTFPAAMQAICKSISNLMKGVEHTPNKKTETSITGRAFAPGKGVQQDTGPEKEAKVREHLRRLAVDAHIRAQSNVDVILTKMVETRVAQQNLERVIEVAKFNERNYPRSDMVEEMEEERDD